MVATAIKKGEPAAKAATAATATADTAESGRTVKPGEDEEPGARAGAQAGAEARDAAAAAVAAKAGTEAAAAAQATARTGARAMTDTTTTTTDAITGKGPGGATARTPPGAKEPRRLRPRHHGPELARVKLRHPHSLRPGWLRP